MAAGLAPPGPARDLIRYLPALPADTRTAAPGKEIPSSSELLELQPSKDSNGDGEPGKRGLREPQAGNSPTRRRVRVSFTASEELLGKIDRARALLRHKHPDGRLEQLVGEAFEDLLDRRDPGRRPSPSGQKHFGALRRERTCGRNMPRSIRDQVWRRDGGQCAFVSRAGQRCPARDWMEYDHILPYALGGRSDDPGNIRLLCRTHNVHAAREFFGSLPRRASKRRRPGAADGSLPGPLPQ